LYDPQQRKPKRFVDHLASLGVGEVNRWHGEGEARGDPYRQTPWRLWELQAQNATGDAIATGVALVVFWPAAFLVRGNGTNAQEVAQLKGDMDAIEQANIGKRCGIQFSRPAVS
jgi:hypothetical protein